MGPVVDFEQASYIDLGIALGRGQRSMAEQFLDGAQIAAAGQKMGGEGMSQSVR